MSSPNIRHRKCFAYFTGVSGKEAPNYKPPFLTRRKRKARVVLSLEFLNTQEPGHYHI